MLCVVALLCVWSNLLSSLLCCCQVGVIVPPGRRFALLSKRSWHLHTVSAVLQAVAKVREGPEGGVARDDGDAQSHA